MLKNRDMNGRGVESLKSQGGKYVLITGGAGFVGVNLADRILSQGKPVMVFDNLSRDGVEKNLSWLREKHPEHLQVMIADIRNKEAVKDAVNPIRIDFRYRFFIKVRFRVLLGNAKIKVLLIYVTD